MTTPTLLYYESNAEQFFDNTVNVEVSRLYERFLSHLPENSLILDAGCGSGRDSKAFSEMGFRVASFDAAESLVKLAQEYCGFTVKQRCFEQIDEIACYDGIWACASLLHVPETSLPLNLARLWNALKPGGIFYLSFKYGEGEREDNGRHFTDANESRLAAWLSNLPEVENTNTWISHDLRPGRDVRWLNALIKRKPAPSQKIVIGGRQHPFLPQLSQAIAQADEIDLTVAFIKSSGLRMLLPDLQAAQKRTNTEPPLRLRILTSDYLDVRTPKLCGF